MLELWRAKLGLATKEEDDGALVDLLLVTMEANFTQGPCRVERGGSQLYIVRNYTSLLL